jgi:hypothetical protein
MIPSGLGKKYRKREVEFFMNCPPKKSDCFTKGKRSGISNLTNLLDSFSF